MGRTTMARYPQAMVHDANNLLPASRDLGVSFSSGGPIGVPTAGGHNYMAARVPYYDVPGAFARAHPSVQPKGAPYGSPQYDEEMEADEKRRVRELDRVIQQKYGGI